MPTAKSPAAISIEPLVNSPSTVEATPKQLGYRLPAEWEPHEATWLSWPHKEASWPGKIETIFPVYAQMVAALARSETVHINVNDEPMEADARGFLDAARRRGRHSLPSLPD